MKVYISADIEGVAGVASPAQLGPEGFEYAQAREWMTAEVLAAIEGARSAGADEFVISDSHGNGQTLLLDRLPPEVQVVRSWPRPLEMVQGIETGGCTCVFLLGYHAGHTDAEGVLAHTISSALYEVRLNGEPANETRIHAAVAGHFDVPVALCSGDSGYIAAARALLPEAETVTTKWPHSDRSVRTLMPARAQAELRATAGRAAARAAGIPPYRIAAPVTVELVFKNRLPAQLLGLMPAVRQSGATAVEHVAPDMLAALRFIVAAVGYRIDLH
jgi:D-amino peptidase